MDQQPLPKPKKLRQACDSCHSAKMRCGGGTPCASCKDNGNPCVYSVSNRIGRPKGTKNKRTLQRLSQQAENETKNARSRPISLPHHPSSNSSSLGSPICTPPIFPDDMSIDTMMGHGSACSYPLPLTLHDASNSTQFSDPTEVWCNFDGSDPASSASTSTVKASGRLDQPHLIGDPTISPPFDIANAFPTDLMHTMSYGASSYGSLKTSSGLSSDEDTDVTVPSALSRFESADSTYSASFNRCHCLEYHSELIGRLKELEHRHVMPRVDVVLLSAQQALTPWKMVIECPICKHDNNQEVLLLSAISIRSILYRLQSLLIASQATSPLSGSASPERIFANTPASLHTEHHSQGQDEMKSAIGIYEITGPEQTAVTELLVSRTIDRIRFTLQKFKERIDDLKQRHPASSLPSQYHQGKSHSGDFEDECKLRGREDFEQLEKVWSNLDRTVQHIVRAIRNGSTTPV